MKPTRAYNETFLGLHSSGPAGRLGLDVSNHDDITVSPLFRFFRGPFSQLSDDAQPGLPGYTGAHGHTHTRTN